MNDSPSSPLAPFAWVTKRDGRLVPFEADKICQALFAASEALGRPDAFVARELTDVVLHFLTAEPLGNQPTTAQIAELVIKVVRELGHGKLAAAFSEGERAKDPSAPPRERPARPAPEPDVRSNAAPFEGRLYVLVLDDLHTAALRSQGVKQAARRFVEQHMGEQDLAAVVFTSGRSDAAQELTASRRLLLGAVDRFIGRRLRSSTLNRIDEYNLRREELEANERIRDHDQFERGYNARVALDTLKGVADWLGGIRGRRKALLYVSEGIDYDVHDPINNHDTGAILNSMRDLVRAATRSNVSVYSIDPRGLHSMGDEMMELSPVQDTSLGLDVRGLQSELRLAQDSLRVLADETVGRAAVATNIGRGVAVAAQLWMYVEGLRVRPGNLIIADSGNHRVRIVR